MDNLSLAKEAAQDTINKVHAYMRANPDSELHRQGKMFGVLVCATAEGKTEYLRAFSAMLDGRYTHEGFVPPVYEMTTPPVGTSREESQRLQRLLFAQYNFSNGLGETRNLLDIFASQPPILSPEEWFNKSTPHSSISNLQSQPSNSQSPISYNQSSIPSHHSPISNQQSQPSNSQSPISYTQSSIPTHHSPISNSKSTLPPSGAGECCAPKLLQFALTHSLRPLAMAEFWIGAPSRTELRQEGIFYPPCTGKCMPILRHMLKGLEVEILRSDTPYSIEDFPTIDILYEDNCLMVVNKPAGILSVPGKTGEPSLLDLLQTHTHCNYLQPVHRLDQDTSGLLVVAKSPEIYKTLQAYFQRRDIYKRYEAVIKPITSTASSLSDRKTTCTIPTEGTITLPLLPNPFDRPRQMVNYEHGKPAITTYRIREYRPDGTLLIDFFPHTGRTHQLRVHAAHPDGLNAPIVGDRLYGTPAKRLYLHAAELHFTHPLTQEEMHFCIPSGF